MPLSLDEFWNLAERSRVFGAEERADLRHRFQESRGENPRGGGRVAAEWLVKQRKLTVYQAKILLKGKPGPFQFGQYRILGSRFATLSTTQRFTGLHVGTHHRVLLHFWLDRDEQLWQRACQRADAARRVRHPNLDRVYETVSAPDFRLGITAWPEGDTLGEMLEQRKHLPAAQACLVIQQLASGLAHLHALGFAHGHIGPNEAVVQPGGHAKMLRQPFVGSEPIDLGRYQSPEGRVAARYLAPEFLLPDAGADSLTDIYAVGCLLYELIAGRPPFSGETLEQIMAEHATSRIQPLEDFAAVPSGLTEVVSFMMAKRRELRYRDMTEVIDKLNAFVPTGIRQTTPRSRATESYYLAHLQQTGPKMPQHLARNESEPPPNESTRLGAERHEQAATSIGVDDLAVGESEVCETNIELDSAARRPVGRYGGVGRASRRAYLPATMTAVALITLLVILKPWGRHEVRPKAPVGSQQRSKSIGDPPAGSRDVAKGPSQPLDGAKRSTGTWTVTRVPDDGATLWVSPTDGQPLDLKYTPSGAQLFLHVRPASLLKSSEGEKLLRALGPKFSRFRERLESRLGVSLREIDGLLVAWMPVDTGPPRAVSIFELSSDGRDRLAKRIENQKPTTVGPLGDWGDDAVLLPTDSPHLIVVGDRELLEPMATRTVAPPLRRQLETLRMASDANRHVTLMGTPNFVSAEGRSMLSDQLQGLSRPLLDFFGDSTQAVLLSLHVDKGTYVEMRWVYPPEQNPSQLLTDRRRQAAQLPQRIGDFLAERLIDPYWQPLAVRLPLMAQYFSQQVRGGIEGTTVVLNAALPPGSAHNLVLATELATASSTLSDGLSSDSTAVIPEKSIDQILDTVLTLTVDQQSLETVMKEFADAVRQQPGCQNFSIRIVGTDLQLDGITRNQQIRNLELADQPVRQILTKLVMRANPTSASDARQPGQKLVWVVSPDDNAGVLITTRTAALQKAYALPIEFVAESVPTGLQ